MTTTPKAQKDKPHTPAPRLTPRPTAASAARAARNATNRNLLLPHAQRQSPNRTSNSPVSVKAKSPAVRNPPRCDSKSDIKINRNSDDGIDNITVPLKQEHDSYIVENVSVVIMEETSNYSNVADLEELNETDHFDDKCNEDECIERVTEQTARSRPHTPALSSRPQTPKSLQSSRPQTPRIPSRPTTPVHPRHSTPASRPNTPQRLATPNRPTTPIHEKIQNSVISPPRSPIKEDDDIKSVFSMKQKQFLRMKKELDMKQQAVLEVFDCLRGLRERMCQEGLGGGEGLQQQELVVFNVADWAADEVAQLCRDAAASAATDGAAELINNIVPFDECALAEVDAKVATVPTRFADLCLQAFTARQELIDWVKNLIEKNPENNSESLEKIARYNAQGLELCDTLRELKSCADSVVDTVTQLSRRACRERSALVAVGESLVREIAHLRQELDMRIAAINELRQVRSDNETIRMLEEARRELEEERAARLSTKDKLSTTESQLRQTRVRVTKMDRQLREAEASIASLTGTVKTLEDQSRQREVQLEARARKLKESLKTGEVASGHIAQQRDALQTEVAELKEQIDTMIAQHKATVQDLTNQLKDVKTVLEEQKRMTQHEIDQKQALQVSLTESQNTIEELKAKITELENSRPNPELPTEREMDLWAELQATKDTLRMTEDEVTACKREKVRFLETMTKITESDNKVGMQQKLAAELLSKEEIVGKMQIQIRELTKNIKLNEQKVAQYEQYVRDLQAHNRAVANCQEAPNGISYQDLQQEIMNLRMSLLEAVHRNEELSEMLMQKEQQLEQQDKTSRAQVREELINMLKNKETEQSRELSALQQDLEHRMNIVGEVNKQIAAKAEEIQELFATLENKQQQIHRLEKIVLALEEQQRRAQAQRTRHEEKIAALEHELAAGGNRRERKFLFF
ncbi:myosin-3-like isoform X2 [Ostrinia nubilalis]|uniref:myosin-3-like isoform X2 n=1 Tax=Ostrinia nubilalis TaxID=29057 RepID=UPI0030826467